MGFSLFSIAARLHMPVPPVVDSAGPAPEPATARGGRVGVVVAAALLPLLLVAAAAPARARQGATVQEILDGRELYIDQRQARVKQQAVAPQEISTGRSRGQLLFNSGAAGRLTSFSLLRLGSGCFQLERGRILVSGPQSGCTRSARLSVRGTNYVLEVDEDGAAEVAVLEGSVEVEPLKDGEPTGEQPTTVEAGQRLSLSPEGVVLTLLELSAGDYSRIFSGPLFEGFRTPLPGIGSLESHVRRYLPGVTLPRSPLTPVFPGFNLVPRLF